MRKVLVQILLRNNVMRRKKKRLEELRQEALFAYGINEQIARTKDPIYDQRTEKSDGYLYDERVRTRVPKREYQKRTEYPRHSDSRSLSRPLERSLSRSREPYTSRNRDLRQELREKRESRGHEVWNRLERKERSTNDRHHPYQRKTDSYRGSRDTRHDSEQVWRPKNGHGQGAEPNQKDILETPTSKPADQNNRSRNTRADSQRTVSEVPPPAGGRRAHGHLIRYQNESESERIRRIKGKAKVVELSKAEKYQQFLKKTLPMGNLAIREPLPSPGQGTQQHGNLPKSLEKALDEELSFTPLDDEILYDVEEGEALTADQIDYMINELADDPIDDEMMANDDLLGEELASDAEKIDAISQLSPMEVHD
ncbi:unnamed protein product [Microthlaspi erraticum]|uniref:Uncharacterized protein n=1 Tax=Microthlaspi erraticum TaxID=1685480 RepID=A0A6D2I433_9BRAS|nr:unnamed protein product [Microthlaspi erraticum]